MHTAIRTVSYKVTCASSDHKCNCHVLSRSIFCPNSEHLHLIRFSVVGSTYASLQPGQLIVS